MLPNDMKAKLVLFLLLNVVSQFSYAIECFEQSPFVAAGGKVFSEHHIPEVTTKQYDDIKTILKAAEGSWKGETIVKECLGTKSSPKITTETHELDGRADFDGRLYRLKLERYIREKRSKGKLEIVYLLTDSNFSIDESQTGNVEVLTSTPTGVSFYRRIKQTNVMRGGLLAKETAYVVEASGREIILKEYLYINGELVSEKITELR